MPFPIRFRFKALPGLILISALPLAEVDAAKNIHNDTTTQPAVFPISGQLEATPNNDSTCLNSWRSYLTAYGWNGSLHASNLTDISKEVVTKVFRTIQSQVPGVVYTECDGIPRFRPTGTNVLSITPMAVTVTQTQSYQKDTSRSIEPPPCGLLGQKACDGLYSTYLAEQFDYTNASKSIMLSPDEACSAADSCAFMTDSQVVLIFWPPKIRSRDICALQGKIQCGLPAILPLTTTPWRLRC